MVRHLFAVAFCGCVAVSTSAQSPAAWIIEVSSATVSPSNPSVNVRISARFPVEDWAFARGHMDVLLGEGSWSGFRGFPPFAGAVGIRKVVT